MLLFLVISCGDSWRVERDGARRNVTELVVLETNVKFDFSDSIQKIDLTGKWIQHSAWIKKDSTWKGFKSLDVNFQYNFHTNSVFQYSKIINDTLTIPVERGDYNLLQQQRVLTFTKNENGDTLFQQGDTAKFMGLYVYSLSDSVLRIEGCFVGHCEEEEFIEFRKY